MLAGGITARDISIADDPAFSRDPFLRAKSLHVGVDLVPLLLSRSLRVNSHIHEPEVVLLHSAGGKWNFSSLGGNARAPNGAPRPSAAQEFSVQKLRIVDGRVIVGSSAAGGKPSTYESVNLGSAHPGVWLAHSVHV